MLEKDYSITMNERTDNEVIYAGSHYIVGDCERVLTLEKNIVGVKEILWSVSDCYNKEGAFILLDGTTIVVLDGPGMDPETLKKWEAEDVILPFDFTP